MATRGERDTPAAFSRAVASLSALRPRSEVVVTETPAPTRLAPYAVALSAEIAVDEDDLATGRLVLLHDPAGQESWGGTSRFVAYIRAAVEKDLAEDQLLCEVAWSWLTEALVARDAPYSASSGTVTRTASQGFGGMAEDPARSEVEIRASWTPTGDSPAGSDAGAHALAWTDLLAQAAGLPPVTLALVGASTGPDGGGPGATRDPRPRPGR